MHLSAFTVKDAQHFKKKLFSFALNKAWFFRSWPFIIYCISVQTAYQKIRQKIIYRKQEKCCCLLLPLNSAFLFSQMDGSFKHQINSVYDWEHYDWPQLRMENAAGLNGNLSVTQKQQERCVCVCVLCFSPWLAEPTGSLGIFQREQECSFSLSLYASSTLNFKFCFCLPPTEHLSIFLFSFLNK